jgi:hypothetical protein
VVGVEAITGEDDDELGSGVVAATTGSLVRLVAAAIATAGTVVLLSSPPMYSLLGVVVPAGAVWSSHMKEEYSWKSSFRQMARKFGASTTKPRVVAVKAPFDGDPTKFKRGGLSRSRDHQ